MKERRKIRRFEYKGFSEDDSILVGSHGNSVIKAEGTFTLSGIIYSPKYTVTVYLKGSGAATFTGKCYRLIVKRMKGGCILDLSNLSCKELQISASDKSVVIAGKVRTISPAHLEDDSILQLSENPVILNYTATGNAKLLSSTNLKPEARPTLKV